MKTLTAIFSVIILSTMEPNYNKVEWCSCLESTNYSDLELSDCDKKYDPQELLDYENDCLGLDKNERN